MGWKSLLLKPYAASIFKNIKYASKNAVDIQNAILLKNIRFAEKTAFGKEHNFKNIHTHAEYVKNVPLRPYPLLEPYIQRIINGESNVLWPGKPKYLVGTAGTTGGIKHIPLSHQSIPYHIRSAIKTGMNYAYRHGHMDIFDGKLIFLSGSPKLDTTGNIPIGRLSGIVNHEIPRFLRPLQVPSYETNAIADWNLKIEKIALETHKLDLRMIGGIPPWIVMYLEKLLEVTGKKIIADVFPNLKMVIHGGVNYQPYKPILDKLIGKKVDYVETYPSTEGYIAFQDEKDDDGLLLSIDSGVFYEFVPSEEIFNESPTRLTLSQVELNKNYALIINNNAGLWGSIIGDMVRFVSLDPYKIKMVGRISQFISAFGEHIVASDVDEVMARASAKSDVIIKEFTVAPEITDRQKRHIWLIEFEKEGSSIQDFERILDDEMKKQNFHYRDLVDGNVISPLKIIPIKSNGFRKYLKHKGALGGQNKVPRLSNTMDIANGLLALQ